MSMVFNSRSTGEAAELLGDDEAPSGFAFLFGSSDKELFAEA